MYPQTTLQAQQLEKLKGVIHTCNGASMDVMDEEIGFIHLKSQKSNDQQILNVSYLRLLQKLFVLILPEGIYSQFTQYHLLRDLIGQLEFLFNLEEIFLDKNFHSKLNLMFYNFFKRLNENFEIFCNSFHEAYPFLPLNFDLSMKINSELTILESSLNKEDLKINENSRVNLILGSCLFHNGHLICTHLNKVISFFFQFTFLGNYKIHL